MRVIADVRLLDLTHRLFQALALAALLSSFGFAVGASDVAHNWKSLYQSGKLNTPYKHYSVIVDGVAGARAEEFGGRPGPAFLVMKIWASSTKEAAHMARLFADRAGFELRGKIEVYNTEPSEPPRDQPHAYDIKFTPYDSNKK